MKINEVIRTRRQALGLTQEGLAERLGVSAPAVNKWERALNYPDITLLPTLARILGVDLNTLLAFQEDMSQEEIGQFLNELAETARQSGCEAAFQMARNKLREFPGNDLLAYSTAGVLQGVLALDSEGSGKNQAELQQEVSALYERTVRSPDARVQAETLFTLAAQCIGQGELERAETLLEQLPGTHPYKNAILARLREKQGRREEAWILLEQDLFHQACGVQTVLHQMLELAEAEGSRDRAQRLADAAEKAGTALDIQDSIKLSAPFQLALTRQDGPRALGLLSRLLDSLLHPQDLQTSPLYRHLPDKEGEGAVLAQHLLKQIETGSESQFLKDVPGYSGLVRRYQTCTS